jgi:hypothetical protein
MITKINTNMKLSEHFTLAELTKTSVMIENVPNEAQVNNLKRLCGWLEELREKNSLTPNPSPRGEGNLEGEGSRYKETPIIINSGYRSSQVNKAVGGAPNSNHLTGCAVDIHVSGMEQLIRYAAILLDISDERQEDFDELLLERSPRGSYWLHFAVRPEGNRRKIVFLRV